MSRTPDVWRAMTLSLLVCSSVATSAGAGSVERVKVFRTQGWLHVNIRATALLDERTVSTVESGLPGSCVYRIHVEDRDGDAVGERLVELSVRLDLWEDVYVLRGPHGTAELTTLAAADSALSHLDAVRVLPTERLNDAREYRVQVEVRVQPLAASDQARISRYVSQNTGSSRQEFALNLSALFNQMFGQRGGAQNAGDAYRSTYFKLVQLEESP